MQAFAPYLPIAIPLLPILTAAFLPWCSRHGAVRLATAAVLMAFALSVWTFVEVVQSGPWSIGSYAWIQHESLDLRLSLIVDQLSVIMLALVSGVSVIVHLYARRYMQDEPGYARFFALIGLVTGITLGLVLSGDLILLVALWQLMGLGLYLLLAFNYSSQSAVDRAGQSLIIGRLGDATFILGVMLLIAAYGTTELKTLFARAVDAPVVLNSLGWLGLAGPELDVNTVAALLIFGGAMAKSAQFPLHTWLPETMEGPTPVSALMHAGLVNAGGFLLNRLAPLYSSSPTSMQVVFVIGTITALLGSTIMLTQNDVKRSLGFSTVGQMGYMTMECGLGAYALAVFHLIAHGIFKATLFMNAGSVIHATRRSPGGEADLHAEPRPPRSRLPLIVGLAATVSVPLGILVGVHELLGISLAEQQGALVLLFFGWVTASQAALSLLGGSVQGSAKATAVMLLTLFVVVFGYLWAGHAFEQFLYPPGSASAAALTKIEIEWRFFYPAIAVAVILILLGWFAALRKVDRGEAAGIEVRPWYERLYVHLHAGLYLEAIYQRTFSPLRRAAQQVDRQF